MEEFIKKNMNTLLVSENDSDYETLVKYGFTNITHFKSPIVALEYFENHPEMKEQYELIICGDVMADKDNFAHPRFTHKITNLFITPNCNIFYKWDYDRWFEYIGKRCLGYNKFDTLEEILDRYLDKTEVKESNKEFTTVIIEEKEMTLPKKIEDIRVLFLQGGYSHRPETNAEVLDSIGIKHYTLTPDFNSSLQFNAVPYLGDYDIIIADMAYSRKLLSLEDEVLEQDKYKGNALTMLVCNDVGGVYEDFHVAFECSFVSNVYSNLPKEEKNYFNIYTQNEEYTPNEYFLKTVIRRYIDELNKVNKEQIDISNLPSVEEMIERRKMEAEERDRKILELQKQKEEEEKPLETIDHIRTYAKRYLNLIKKRNYLPPLEGLFITEKNNYITVCFTIQNRKMCAISFSKSTSDNDDSLKLFALQTATKNGTLSDPLELAVYLEKWNDNPDVPRKPTEDEWQKIEGIKKRVDLVLVPIVDEFMKKKKKTNDKPKSYQKINENKKYYQE